MKGESLLRKVGFSCLSAEFAMVPGDVTTLSETAPLSNRLAGHIRFGSGLWPVQVGLPLGGEFVFQTELSIICAL
jgi:hypothetical protein